MMANVYSQNGEDSYILSSLYSIPESLRSGWCVELGAWDGEYLSNCANLIHNFNYRAVMIEANKSKFKKLKRAYPDSKVIKVHRFVDVEGENCLDSVLSQTSIPHDFDFLSIDIDGMDYYIFQSLLVYSPKMICIEFNANIPNFVNYVQDNDFKLRHGSSALAIKELAERKNYKLTNVVSCNLFLVRNDLISYIPPTRPSLEMLNILGNDPVVVWSGFDGTLLSNKKTIATPQMSFNISRLNPLPKSLRTFVTEYSIFQKALYLWIRMIQRIFF